MPLNRFLGMMCDALDEAPSRLMGLQQAPMITSPTLEERWLWMYWWSGGEPMRYATFTGKE